MILRADHIAGAGLIGAGLLVLALSGDLPIGRLSMPGAGFLPSLVAVLLVLFGIGLLVFAPQSLPFARLQWSDLPHAVAIVLISGVAVALYTRIGFIITMSAMLFALLVVVERKPLLTAAAVSVAATLLAYALFGMLLRVQLPAAPFWL
jgi:hypothetical protein